MKFTDKQVKEMKATVAEFKAVIYNVAENYDEALLVLENLPLVTPYKFVVGDSIDVTSVINIATKDSILFDMAMGVDYSDLKK